MADKDRVGQITYSNLSSTSRANRSLCMYPRTHTHTHTHTLTVHEESEGDGCIGFGAEGSEGVKALLLLVHTPEKQRGLPPADSLGDLSCCCNTDISFTLLMYRK